MAGRAAYDQLKSSEEARPHNSQYHPHDVKNIQAREAIPKHRANTRTALRTLVVYGQSHLLSRPDDEQLILPLVSWQRA